MKFHLPVLFFNILGKNWVCKIVFFLQFDILFVQDHFRWILYLTCVLKMLNLFSIDTRISIR